VTAEEQIRERLAAGDHRGAATEAIQRLGPQVLGYLRSILRNEMDAADAFGVFAEDLWKGIGSFRGESTFKTWAYRVAWHAAAAMQDQGWKRLVRRFEPGEASRLAEDVRTRTVVRDERQRLALERLRAALTPEEQTLLHLRLDQEMEWTEVAEVLSAAGAEVTPATVRKRYERLKERLAALLRETGDA
jgi:RNA polymerase sigma-70 factor (ECF subfamily)